MTTLFGFHEVEDTQHWANAWKEGPGSRHEMFAKIGIKARNFKDPKHPNLVGVLFEVPDMQQFQSFMATDEVKKAMQEDHIKIDTLRILTEFTP